jgi:magnesium-transporting ATPase (P-type)
VVVETGQRTELGRISVMLEEVESVSTPLIRQIAGFSRWLAAAILMLSALTFAIGFLWRGHAASDMFMMVVALAASAIPEGLPAILTATLALGVQRMARHKAIIRKLPAVETLGAVTVICSDKTGTLTRNEMTVQRLVTAARCYQIGGVGYAPEGAFQLSGATCSPADDPDLMESLRAASLCNDAALRREDAGWTIVGDPTEGALIVLAKKAGLDSAAERHAWPRRDVIPFESEHRFMATLHHEPREHRDERRGRHEDVGGVIYIKGAPERVLEMCSTQYQVGPDQDGRVQPLDPDYWRRQAADCAAHGMRLLSIAVKRIAPKDELALTDIEQGCSMLALVGIIDPPREEAIAAVAACRAAGVRVKMITGDHVDTARAIGAQLSIGQNRPALTGAEIELLDDVALRDVVTEVDIYARASPEHKLRLVQALQARSEVVAMTGDGVNDAPALKRADVGVAMGRKGTDAAKDAADMVLTDDNFATIADAVRSGRGVYDNIRKFILFMLPTNGGEGLVVVVAILFDLVLPLLAVQVLWINMVTSSTLGLALAFERTEANVMQRPPRDPGESLLTPFFVWRITMVSVLMMIGALGLFLWKLEQGASLETARTMAVNAIVFSEMFYLFNSRRIYDSVLSRQGLLGNPYVLGAVAVCLGLQAAFTHAAPLQRIFGSTGLTAMEWLGAALAGAFVFVIAEFEKFVQRRLAAAKVVEGRVA